MKAVWFSCSKFTVNAAPSALHGIPGFFTSDPDPAATSLRNIAPLTHHSESLACPLFVDDSRMDGLSLDQPHERLGTAIGSASEGPAGFNGVVGVVPKRVVFV
ncbi:hypothetical protein [Novipirellula sp.]|uniref:hypothetical protein n=1 Tax=Novipirellula sp. TaxID=2795430 RepID=UPI0035637D28